jgi:hypothetical protein
MSPLHDDKLFIALILTRFHGLMCLGELTWPNNPHLHNWNKVSLRKTVKWPCSSYKFFLLGHKADKFFEGNQILILQTNEPWDPLRFFIRYLQSCDVLFPLSPALWL